MKRKGLGKKVIGTIAAAALTLSMVVPAYAAESGSVQKAENGTDVFAGVKIDNGDTDAQIRVTVPTLFAFVVNGTTDQTDATAINVNDGTLLVPNVKINVTQTSDGTAGNIGKFEYVYNNEDDSRLFTNYSTIMDDTSASGRAGIAVDIIGSYKNKADIKDSNYWNHVAAVGSANKDEFKEFTLNAGTDATGLNRFSVANGLSYTMERAITLGAPDVSAAGSVDTQGRAVDGRVESHQLGVEVGGQRGQYHQIEQSLKIGTIEWTVSYETDAADGAATHPNEEPLSKGDVTP